MVGRTTGTDAERAQLVLIGAITIAFILLGVVVVYNGVQYTQTVNTGEADRSAEHARTVEAELEAGVSALINASDGYTEFNQAFLEFIPTYQNTTAQRQPAVVTIDSWTTDWSNETVTVDYQYDDGAVSLNKTITVNASEGSP